MEARVLLKIAPFKRLNKSIKGPSGKILKAMERLIPIYRLFIYERFLRFSGGGGNWKKLNAQYKAYKAKAGLSTGILTRTNILEKQLKPQGGKKGLLVRKQKDGLSIRFSPRKRYPSGVKVETVLTIHDQGLGQARRTVLVSPNNQVYKRMAKPVVKGIQATLDG